MVYLVAGVVVVGLVCLLDLVLTFGVIRRLREHTTLINQFTQAMPDAGGLQVGDTVEEFTATTTAGERVSRESLAGPTLVGFFSPGCQPCAVELPRFVERAKTLPDGPRQVLAVIDADTTEAAAYAEQLGPVARLVLERHGGPAHTAFAAPGYPTLYVVSGDGEVLASGMAMDSLDAALTTSFTAA